MSASLDHEAVWQEQQLDHIGRLESDHEYARAYGEEVAFENWRADRAVEEHDAHDREVQERGGCPNAACYHNAGPCDDFFGLGA
jgi:hypothetical protein